MMLGMILACVANVLGMNLGCSGGAPGAILLSAPCKLRFSKNVPEGMKFNFETSLWYQFFELSPISTVPRSENRSKMPKLFFIYLLMISFQGFAQSKSQIEQLEKKGIRITSPKSIEISEDNISKILNLMKIT